LGKKGNDSKGEGHQSTSSIEESGDTRCNQTTDNEIESSLGGSIDGPSSWMVYAELCRSVDNRTDELRLLGNGVVPATATKAFVVLFDKLMNEGRLKEEQGVLSL
jgi:hypothetical protein